MQVGLPTKLPGPLTIEAVAVCVPASIVPPSALTVIVSMWFVPTALVAVAGVIWMFASTHVLLALPLPPAAVFTAVFVVRVIDGAVDRDVRGRRARPWSRPRPR